jgi:hypothetical protein
MTTRTNRVGDALLSCTIERQEEGTARFLIHCSLSRLRYKPGDRVMRWCARRQSEAAAHDYIDTLLHR